MKTKGTPRTNNDELDLNRIWIRTFHESEISQEDFKDILTSDFHRERRRIRITRARVWNLLAEGKSLTEIAQCEELKDLHDAYIDYGSGQKEHPTCHQIN